MSLIPEHVTKVASNGMNDKEGAVGEGLNINFTEEKEWQKHLTKLKPGR